MNIEERAVELAESLPISDSSRNHCREISVMILAQALREAVAMGRAQGLEEAAGIAERTCEEQRTHCKRGEAYGESRHIAAAIREAAEKVSA